MNVAIEHKLTVEKILACDDINQLKEWLNELDESIIAVELQLNKAIYSDTYSDREWFGRAKSARRVYGFLKNQCQSRLSEFKEKKPSSFDKIVVDVCKEVLDERQFQEIIGIAIKRANNKP